MTEIFNTLMDRLYKHNVWDNFIADQVDPNVQGWNGTHPSLSRLPLTFTPQIIVDVGVWKGQSTITMANNLRENDIDGVVIAIDTFLGSREHWDGERNLFARDNGLPNLYRLFMSNVAEHGLTNYVIPMPQTSTSACYILRRYNIRPTLIHVDAAHEYREALADIADYWEILADHGVMIGDDYHESWPGIVRAAGEFSASIGKPLTIESPKFILTKST